MDRLVTGIQCTLFAAGVLAIGMTFAKADDQPPSIPDNPAQAVPQHPEAPVKVAMPAPAMVCADYRALKTAAYEKLNGQIEVAGSAVDETHFIATLANADGSNWTKMIVDSVSGIACVLYAGHGHVQFKTVKPQVTEAG